LAIYAFWLDQHFGKIRAQNDKIRALHTGRRGSGTSCARGRYMYMRCSVWWTRNFSSREKSSLRTCWFKFDLEAPTHNPGGANTQPHEPHCGRCASLENPKLMSCSVHVLALITTSALSGFTHAKRLVWKMDARLWPSPVPTWLQPLPKATPIKKGSSCGDKVP